MKNGRKAAAQKEAPDGQRQYPRHGTEMTGAEMVVQALIDQGVEHVFGYPGGAVLPIYDEIIQQDQVEHILVRHEQGAGHAAEGYARSTGKVGVALVTSGPGATNMVTPLADALMDSIPIVCITGQVPTHLIGNDAFQECDTVGITRPATKHNWLVRDVNDLVARPPRGLLRRHRTAGPARCWSTSRRTSSSPPAPTPARATSSTRATARAPRATRSAIRAAVELIAKAKRPVFYTGGGVINSGPRASELLRELVHADRLPDHLDPDGPRRLSRPPTRSGSACSACTAPARPTTSCTTAT